ncbi:MAG: hypothetical protein J2P47_13595, partial [Acetobacteraceae bacterium]|nr:hypothetical protein [Acetobacteraceae bacterium]
GQQPGGVHIASGHGAARATPYAPTQRGGLFAEPQRPAAIAPQNPGINGTEPRRSIFQAVTGRLRNARSSLSQPAEPPPPRAEPLLAEPRTEQARASVRPAGGEDMGLDIPAFLRRQSS